MEGKVQLLWWKIVIVRGSNSEEYREEIHLESLSRRRQVYAMRKWPPIDPAKEMRRALAVLSQQGS